MLGCGISCSDSSSPLLVPMFAKRRVQALASGEKHIAVISNEEVFAWGANSFGECGVSSEVDTAWPVSVNFPRFTESQLQKALLVAGPKHTFLITREVKYTKREVVDSLSEIVSFSRVFVWGQNKYGNCGIGSGDEFVRKPLGLSFPSSLTEKHTKTITCIHALQTNALSTICLTKSGEVYVWGVLHFLSLSRPSKSLSSPVLIQNVMPNLNPKCIFDINVVSSGSLSLTLFDIDKSSNFDLSMLLSVKSDFEEDEKLQLQSECARSKKFPKGKSLLSSLTNRSSFPQNFKTRSREIHSSASWLPQSGHNSDEGSIFVHIGGVSVPFSLKTTNFKADDDSRSAKKSEGIPSTASMTDSLSLIPQVDTESSSQTSLFNCTSIREVTSLIQSLKVDTFSSSYRY
jgi:hypothetical protein